LIKWFVVEHSAKVPSNTSPCAFGNAVITYNHMVVDTKIQERTDGWFHALADATRRDILVRSLHNEHSVSELASFYPMSFAAVQKHVALLERVDLVTKHRRGREQMVRGNVATVRNAFSVLEQLEEVWRGRIDRMNEILSED
jgi:DNA-binding transcriptional ArsR family regulator